MYRLIGSILLCLLLTVSCDRSAEKPDTLLRSYINKRFSNEITKSNIGRYLGGELIEKIEALDEQLLESFLSLGQYELVKMNIHSEACEQESCFITYSLVYRQALDESKDDKSATTTVKKVAQLKRFDGKWKISEISHVKTLHDFKSPLDVLK